MRSDFGPALQHTWYVYTLPARQGPRYSGCSKSTFFAKPSRGVWSERVVASTLSKMRAFLRARLGIVVVVLASCGGSSDEGAATGNTSTGMGGRGPDSSVTDPSGNAGGGSMNGDDASTSTTGG